MYLLCMYVMFFFAHNLTWSILMSAANQPNEVTQTTINSIFFPGDHDSKSVLLKRGPTLFDGLEERELLLFTHAFVLSRIEFDNLVTLLFDMNSVKMGSKEDTEKELQKRFDAIDSDCTGGKSISL